MLPHSRGVKARLKDVTYKQMFRPVGGVKNVYGDTDSSTFAGPENG